MRKFIRLASRTALAFMAVYFLLALAWHQDRIPPIPPTPFNNYDPLQDLLQLVYRTLGPGDSFASSVFGFHVWYNSKTGSGTALAPGSVGPGFDVNIPSTPDHLPVCFELNYGYFANSTGSGTVYAGTINGTDNSEDSGCPLWPYNNVGGHAFGPGLGNGKVGVSIPNNDNFVEVMDFRQDGMYFNSVGACGGNIAINTSSCSAGTCTLNLASSPLSVWGGTGNGEYMQITGSSVAAWNSIPGQTYTVTGRTASTLTFAGNLASCGSNCGTVYQPYLGGPPPVTLPLGVNGGTPTPTFNVSNASNSTANVDWSEAINIVCFPLISCPNMFGALGCGIGNTMQ